MADSSSAVRIQSFRRVIPMIYAYTLPDVPNHDGWVKIGYTDRQTVEARVREQTHTAGLRADIRWRDNAMYKDGSGEYFRDTDFHNYLEYTCGVARNREWVGDTEWFKIDPGRARECFDRFAAREPYASDGHSDYTLRAEQRQAVDKAFDYFQSGGEEFLWNAKPRFGKTLAAYDLAIRMHCVNVLIVTNRPSIANSWADDFAKFIGWKHKLAFVSDTDALKNHPGVLTRAEYLDRVASPAHADDYEGVVAFESLQGLKGSVYFGGEFDKNAWMAKEYLDARGEKVRGTVFDLLIIDESHEGVDTMRTDQALKNIARKHTLYLSGTPFKALAGGQFSDKQIFNWSYADEQEAKERWDSADVSPYEALPRMALYTYQLSPMIREVIERGIDLSDDGAADDYAFDLNEFFATNESKKFIHEDEVVKFLHALSTQEKYPFSTPELRRELSHTLWLLNRVDSAKALKKLLKADPVFGEYEIVLAAGDGRTDEDEKAGDKAFNRVKAAIAAHEKTITLSVGQLTVGVTIPEWSGVMMLCNLESPSAYMQAAFRAQNPCAIAVNGQYFRKETAYVFDFDPARTLIIFDDFANNLIPDMASGGGTADDRRENIKKLLNFFPVLGEDSAGKMVELDAAQVLSIPRKIKSTEVVRRGFMSNFLFQNIGAVFSAPKAVREILDQLKPAQEEKKKRESDALDRAEDVPVNDAGEVEIPNEIVIGKAQDLFGDKIYETVADEVRPAIEQFSEPAPRGVIPKENVSRLAEDIKGALADNVLAPAFAEYGVKKSAQKRVEREVSKQIDAELNQSYRDYEQKARVLDLNHQKSLREADTEAEVQTAQQRHAEQMQELLRDFTSQVQQTMQNAVSETPKAVVEKLEKQKAEGEKKTIEDEVRARLRGFARTIPSFIMAYGDGHLTLKNFDDYTEDDVFKDVTGITEEQFRFLRDGGDYTDDQGNPAHFAGHLFDEVVFDDSIAEFWRKKCELADYFDETKQEDIFDYIPPQRTNQIFTPRWVVSKMVDELENENPGCFDDPDHTFADLYMKSGLYITEIVKRLYRSPRMKALFPDDGARVRHILRHQVYGMAPTRIIYLIATNYILGFDEALKAETTHFVQADAAEAAKAGTLPQLVDACFGPG